MARTNPLIGDPKLNGVDLDLVQPWRPLGEHEGRNQWYNPFSVGTLKRQAGEIVLRSDKNFMITAKQIFRDFVLELDAHVPEGNSGIFFRCQVGDKKLFGYQAEIDPSQRQYTGGLFDNTGRGFLFPKANDEASLVALRKRQGASVIEDGWNHYRVECFGNRIRVAVNGRWITDLTDNEHAEGVIGLQHHGNASEYRFRNIRILPL